MIGEKRDNFPFVYTTWLNSNLFTFYTLDYHVLFKLLSKTLNKKRRFKKIKWAVIYLKYNEWMVPELWDACPTTPGFQNGDHKWSWFVLTNR